mmetsp:Transcript_29494/g.44814  ORF Transcript_29494/g.44814 Transcript_29494/m.44814 type:complete len:87 (-) Transcript_29494:557-817(-)
MDASTELAVEQRKRFKCFIRALLLLLAWALLLNVIRNLVLISQVPLIFGQSFMRSSHREIIELNLDIIEVNFLISWWRLYQLVFLL